jgi:predicted PurR-regulated permease PerM
VRALEVWEIAVSKTGGYLYSRALLALVSSFLHWIAFQAIGTPAPIAMAIWVGLVSQFMPVIGTYVAGVLPLVLSFIEEPSSAIFVIGFIIVYQQIENYLVSPRITARTMDLHPALAFGSAIAGAALLGAIGALLALPGAAMVQAIAGQRGTRRRRPNRKRRNVDASRRTEPPWRRFPSSSPSTPSSTAPSPDSRHSWPASLPRIRRSSPTREPAPT